MNSREKGKRGERQFRDQLREAGFCKAYRTAQYCGKGPDSSDVNCPELPTIHWEVKNCQAGNPYVWMEQAEDDAGRNLPYPSPALNKTPVVAHKRNGKKWLAILSMDDFLNIVRRSDLVKMEEG